MISNETCLAIQKYILVTTWMSKMISCFSIGNPFPMPYRICEWFRLNLNWPEWPVNYFFLILEIQHIFCFFFPPLYKSTKPIGWKMKPKIKSKHRHFHGLGRVHFHFFAIMSHHLHSNDFFLALRQYKHLPKNIPTDVNKLQASIISSQVYHGGGKSNRLLWCQHKYLLQTHGIKPILMKSNNSSGQFYEISNMPIHGRGNSTSRRVGICHGQFEQTERENAHTKMAVLHWYMNNISCSSSATNRHEIRW